jgi:hypothetical protein
MIPILLVTTKEVRRNKFPMWTVVVNGVEVPKLDRWSEGMAERCADRLRILLNSELAKRASNVKTKTKG